MCHDHDIQKSCTFSPLPDRHNGDNNKQIYYNDIMLLILFIPPHFWDTLDDQSSQIHVGLGSMYHMTQYCQQY